VKRVVLDTNVTLSALFWPGNPRRIYDMVRYHKLIMLLSDDMEKEFVRVLGYEKFGLSPGEIIPLVRDIRTHAQHVKTRSRIAVVTIDPTDNIFLECACDGEADVIISGDKHLLDLGGYGKIQIVKAKDFLLSECLQ
jgi:putative PIN family toxin of toxin-antitoxin system